MCLPLLYYGHVPVVSGWVRVWGIVTLSLGEIFPCYPMSWAVVPLNMILLAHREPYGGGVVVWQQRAHHLVELLLPLFLCLTCSTLSLLLFDVLIARESVALFCQFYSDKCERASTGVINGSYLVADAYLWSLLASTGVFMNIQDVSLLSVPPWGVERVLPVQAHSNQNSLVLEEIGISIEIHSKSACTVLPVFADIKIWKDYEGQSRVWFFIFVDSGLGGHVKPSPRCAPSSLGRNPCNHHGKQLCTGFKIPAWTSRSITWLQNGMESTRRRDVKKLVCVENPSCRI